MSKCVAITGATGFIGQRVCSLLHQRGWRVRALLRSPTRAQALQPCIDEALQGALDDRAALARLVTGVTAVVHCAGAVRGASPQAFDRANVDGVRNLLAALGADDMPPRLLCLSSLAAREPELSFYAASKRRGEQLLEQQAGGLEWMVLRPPAVYGPGDRELLPLFKVMAKGFAPLPGRADARFSMIFVDDIAAAVLAWLQQEAVPSGVYSLHDGRPGGYDWTEVCDIVAKLCQRKVRRLAIPTGLLDLPARLNRSLAQWAGYAPMLTPEKLRELRHPDWVCDNEALRKVLDWQPEVQLEDGLRRTPGWCGLLDRD
jgi:nucleoside-diphosphate-sugar epimerase